VRLTQASKDEASIIASVSEAIQQSSALDDLWIAASP
jgi:hypothetical protein